MHEAKVIYTKHESDGALAVLTRCCGDSSTDQWHTLYVQPETSDQEVQDFLAHAQSRCAAQHASRENARAILSRGISQ